MAKDRSTTGSRVVRLDMSIEHRMILRRRIETWRAGDKEDLETPEKLDDPDAARRRIATYEGLIDALTMGRAVLPDEEARSRLTEVMAVLEETEEWKEAKVHHDSLFALLSAVGGPVRPGDCVRDEAAGPTTSADELTIEATVLQRVLALHPIHRSEADLVLELVGEEPEFEQRDAVELAVRDLAGVGLLHIRDDMITPTRAALRSMELQDR